MFCKNCGSMVEEKEKFCKYCGSKLSNEQESVEAVVVANDKSDRNKTADQNNIKKESTPSSKTGLGFVLGLFLGVIGLIIGIFMLQQNEYERKTFIKGWVISLVISIVFVVVYFVIVGGLVLGMA